MSGSIEHVIRQQLEAEYGQGRDIGFLINRWWEEPTVDVTAPRLLHRREYWTVQFDTPPSCTVTNGVSGVSTASTIPFTVTFSEAVTGFATGDVTLSGTAGATTAVVTGSGSVYTVTVSGMTQTGSVVVTVPAAVCVDAGSQPNTASVSSGTDNIVIWTGSVASPIAATQKDLRLDVTPGASSEVSNSAAYTADQLYLVAVTQFRQSSTDPEIPTLSGWGTTWTQVSDNLWTSTGTNRRRTTLFKGIPASSGTGALTYSYAGQPADACITIVECANADTVVQVVDAAHSTSVNVTNSPVTMAAAASSDSRLVAFVACNSAVDATMTFTGSWTSFTTVGSGSAPTSAHMAGWLDADPATDLTPAWVNTTNGTVAYMACVEVSSSGGGGGGGGGADPLFVGATVDRQNTESWAQATANFETAIGASIPIARRFTSSMPTNFSNVGSFAQDIGVRHRIVSVKGEPTQAQLETFIATIPVDGYRTWLLVHHEPENDGGSHTIAWFQGMLNNLHGAWVAQGSRTDVIPSVCLMSWFERDSNGSTSSADWFPAANKIADFTLWLDPYDTSQTSSMEFMVNQTLTLWRAAGGTDWGISETATKRTGATGAAWIAASATYLRSEGAIGFLWFHSAVGANGPWWLTGAEMLAAFGAEVQ